MNSKQISYIKLSDALLGYISAKGGRVQPKFCYIPLANYFGLSIEERIKPRPDGRSGSAWENRVQWTRQRLINQGLVDGSEPGWWKLTEKGKEKAKYIESFYNL